MRSSHLKPGHYFYELLALASLALVSMQQTTETFMVFLQDFDVKVDTDPEVDSPVALGNAISS